MTTEIERLHRQNRRLRLAMIACGAAAIAGVGLGSAPDEQREHEQQHRYVPPKPVRITTDGTYLYKLYDNGHIDRIQIQAMADLRDKQRAQHNMRAPSPTQWEQFILNN
ncbi:MAG: hypothetical protein H6810_00315 [Phycisphaeraceae bacterium]|nr:MAG: hypothetical protein H6810_00315 [Phycisphaeraceae bacterium]